MLRLLILFCPLALTAQAAMQPPADSALTALLMADIPAGGPGGAVGVVHGGKVIYSHYGGLADLDTGREIGPQTRFNIASTAKQFTALCILRLADQSQLSLQDNIRTYLPEWKADGEGAVKISHLLNHTSGIRDVYNLWSLRGLTWWELPLTNRDAYEMLIQQTELNFDPGSQYLYSNSNFLLLTEIVARVSGQAFADYAAQLFADLGMPDTRFAADHTERIPNLARPYFNFATWQTYDLLTDLHGDGALFTTLPDQLRYESLLQHSGELPEDLVRILTQSQELPSDQVDGYGYGVEHTEYRGLPMRFHDGSTGAWKASFRRFPGQDLAVFVLNNSGKFFASDLARDVVDVLLAPQFTGDRYPSVPDGDTKGSVQTPEGLYGVTQGFVIKIARGAGAKLTLERFGRPPIDLIPVRPGVYREATDTTFYQQFARDADGHQQITLFHPSHPPYSLDAFPSDKHASTPCPVFAEGKWTNQETGAAVNLISVDSAVQLVLHGDTLRTEHFAPGLYLTPGYVWLCAERDGSPGLFLFDDRLRWVRFRRKESAP